MGILSRMRSRRIVSAVTAGAPVPVPSGGLGEVCLSTASAPLVSCGPLWARGQVFVGAPLAPTDTWVSRQCLFASLAVFVAVCAPARSCVPRRARVCPGALVRAGRDAEGLV